MNISLECDDKNAAAGKSVKEYRSHIPSEKNTNISVGNPVRVEKTLNPSQEEIDDLHKRYIAELKDLYYEYNPKYGLVNAELVLV